MIYREIIAVCSQTHTEHINTLCGQNVELLNVKPGGRFLFVAADLKSRIRSYSEPGESNRHFTFVNEILRWTEFVRSVSARYHKRSVLLMPSDGAFAVTQHWHTAVCSRLSQTAYCCHSRLQNNLCLHLTWPFSHFSAVDRMLLISVFMNVFFHRS
jgi:hypothetical protein